MNKIDYLFRLSRCFGKPTLHAIESTNNCNLKCPMCPNGSGIMKRKKGFLDVDLFKKVIDEEQKNIKGILQLWEYGEPLLHPKLIDMINYCKEKGIYCNLSTNAMLLDKGIAKDLIDSKLYEITISYDGCTKETLEKYRVGSDFYVVTENIKNFLSLRKSMPNGKEVKVTIQSINLLDNAADIKKIRKEFEKEDVKIKVKGFDTWAGNIPLNGFSTQMRGHGESKRYPCRFLWGGGEGPVIFWDGTVVPCSRDFDGKEVIGNVNEDTLSEIWNSKRMRELRSLHSKGKWDEIELCSKCTEWKGSGGLFEKIKSKLFHPN